jgi:hypothetical protein
MWMLSPFDALEMGKRSLAVAPVPTIIPHQEEMIVQAANARKSQRFVSVPQVCLSTRLR